MLTRQRKVGDGQHDNMQAQPFFKKTCKCTQEKMDRSQCLCRQNLLDFCFFENEDVFYIVINFFFAGHPWLTLVILAHLHLMGCYDCNYNEAERACFRGIPPIVAILLFTFPLAISHTFN